MPVVPTVPTVPVVGGSPTSGNPTPAPNQKPAVPGSQQALGRQQAVFKRIYYPTITSGSLVTFQYLFYKHDAYPLVLCTGKWADGKIAGVNLHYLTYNYWTYLINQFCGKIFNYQSIKSDKFIKNSFRSYKREGLRNIQLLDCNFLNGMLKQIRSYNPTEVEAMRQYLKGQLNQKLGTKADDMTGTNTQSQVTDGRNV